MNDAIDYRKLEPQDGFELVAYKHYDEDSRPSHFDCYTPKQVQAWENDEWQFVGIVVTATAAGVPLGSASLWSIEDGQWTDTDEHDVVTGTRDVDPLRDDNYLNELIPEAIENARENLERINATVGNADAKALDAITAEMSGREWSPDTLEAIAEIVRGTGRVIEDSAEYEHLPE